MTGLAGRQTDRQTDRHLVTTWSAHDKNYSYINTNSTNYRTTMSYSVTAQV